MTTPTGASVWRLYEIDGFPASGPHRPAKADVIAWAASLEGEIAAAIASAASATTVAAGARRGYLAGLTLSTAGSSASFTVQPGIARDGANSDTMTLASSLTKTTSAWAVGAAGALDTGSIATGTWYHVYQIMRPDTGVVDICISLSASAPTTGANIPAAYTKSRRIGSMLTNGSSQWVKFVQRGDEFLWDTQVQDSTATASTTASLIALSAPSGVQVVARIQGLFTNASAGAYVLITSPDQADSAASSTNFTGIVAGNSINASFQTSVRTNTSRQIRVRASAASTTLWINTYGWNDRRGRDD